MLEKPHLLLAHLRNKLFKPQIANRMMNMLVVGPSNHGKSNLLEYLLKDENDNLLSSVQDGNRPSMFKAIV